MHAFGFRIGPHDELAPSDDLDLQAVGMQARADLHRLLRPAGVLHGVGRRFAHRHLQVVAARVTQSCVARNLVDETPGVT